VSCILRFSIRASVTMAMMKVTMQAAASKAFNVTGSFRKVCNRMVRVFLRALISGSLSFSKCRCWFDEDRFGLFKFYDALKQEFYISSRLCYDCHQRKLMNDPVQNTASFNRRSFLKTSGTILGAAGVASLVPATGNAAQIWPSPTRSLISDNDVILFQGDS